MELIATPPNRSGFGWVVSDDFEQPDPLPSVLILKPVPKKARLRLYNLDF